MPRDLDSPRAAGGLARARKLMTYRVWSGEVLLGESELEMRASARGDRMGVFQPTEAFERVAPIFRERQQLVGRLAELAMSRATEAAPAEAMRTLLAETGLGARLRQSHASLGSLELEIRDEAGASLRQKEINIFDVALLEPFGTPEEVKAGIRADMAELGLDPDVPHWLIQVLPVADEGGGEGESEPKRAAG